MNIGIDIGGSHIATGIVLEAGEIKDKITTDFDINAKKTKETAKEFVKDTILNHIKYLLENNKIKKEKISRIGIAVPGNIKDNKTYHAVNLGMADTTFDLIKEIKKEYDVEVLLRNDGTCAALAEKTFGAIKQYEDAIFLCIGTGVGSGAFLNNKLLTPNKARGFEFGHMIIQKEGNTCNCGKKGCFETYVSMKRLKERCISEFNLSKNTTGEQVQQYIRKGLKENNVKVKDMIEEYINNFSIGLSNIINILEPEAICIGGSFVYYEDIFVEKIKNNIQKNGLLFNKENDVNIVVAKLSDNAGIIGSTIWIDNSQKV